MPLFKASVANAKILELRQRIATLEGRDANAVEKTNFFRASQANAEIARLNARLAELQRTSRLAADASTPANVQDEEARLWSEYAQLPAGERRAFYLKHEAILGRDFRPTPPQRSAAAIAREERAEQLWREHAQISDTRERHQFWLDHRAEMDV
jgi:hypothetical protein